MTAAVFMVSGKIYTVILLIIKDKTDIFCISTGILIGYYGINPSSAPREPLDVKLVVDEVTAEKISSNLRSE